MFELIVIICLASSPNDCKPKIFGEYFSTILQCKWAALPLTASLLSEYPQYRAKWVYCIPVKARTKET